MNVVGIQVVLTVQDRGWEVIYIDEEKGGGLERALWGASGQR